MHSLFHYLWYLTTLKVSARLLADRANSGSFKLKNEIFALRQRAALTWYARYRGELRPLFTKVVEHYIANVIELCSTYA